MDEDSGEIQLTQEQERQLAMIESMPLTMETDIPPEEWNKKSPQEQKLIIGLFLKQFSLVW